jgi:SAM-dependent methyltransferase
MFNKIFRNKGTELHKTKSFWSTFKKSYLKRKDFKNYWNKLDKSKLPKEIVELTNIFITSESYNLTSKFWRHLIISHYEGFVNSKPGSDPLIDIIRMDYSGFSYLDEFTVSDTLENLQGEINIKINLLKKHKNLTVSQSLQYNLVLLILYENIKNKNIFTKYPLIKKNMYEKYNPNLLIDGKFFSQNMIISLQEYEKIYELTKSVKEPLKILELGAGYGRTANMILSLEEGIKYVIADLPLSVHFSYNNLKASFPNKKIVNGFNINNNEDMMKAFQRNDVLFIFPHQLKFFKNKTFDLTISIGNLCEMEKKQIVHYMNVYENISKFLYIKVWEISGLPFSFYTYYDAKKKSDYAIKDHWKEHFNRSCFMPSNIYEMGYEF